MTLPQIRTNRFSIILFAAFTCFLVFTGRANMFFMIYIFWWDEFLKTIFALHSFLFKRKKIENPEDFRKKIQERFLMLFVYFIFIIVIFGFMVAFNSDDMKNMVTTFQILFFRNWEFNTMLFLIISRESGNLIFRDENEKITGNKLSLRALVTLHVSIILGVLLWTLASGQFKVFKTDLGELANQLIILPFIVIKLIFDIYQFNQNNNLNQS